jgi:predicted RNA-binding Zn-ribbon protein involved in translation (DUF1610 family)
MDIEMLMAHCCHCGHQVSKSASGTKSIMNCPKCGAELEVIVEAKTVAVTLLHKKTGRRTTQDR